MAINVEKYALNELLDEVFATEDGLSKFLEFAGQVLGASVEFSEEKEIFYVIKPINE